MQRTPTAPRSAPTNKPCDAPCSAPCNALCDAPRNTGAGDAKSSRPGGQPQVFSLQPCVSRHRQRRSSRLRGKTSRACATATRWCDIVSTIALVSVAMVSMRYGHTMVLRSTTPCNPVCPHYNHRDTGALSRQGAPHPRVAAQPHARAGICRAASHCLEYHCTVQCTVPSIVHCTVPLHMHYASTQCTLLPTLLSRSCRTCSA